MHAIHICYKIKVCNFSTEFFYYFWVIRRLLDGKIKNCFVFRLRNTYYNFKQKCLKVTLICAVSRSCKCHWKLTIYEKRIHLKRINSPTHEKETRMKERNKLTSKEAGYMSNDYLALTDLTV